MNPGSNRLRWGLLVALSALLALIPGLAPAGVTLGMAVIGGARAALGTTAAGSQAIDSNSRVIDMSDTIHLLDPNEAALTAITMKLRKAHCINPKVEWLEDDYLPPSSATTATNAATATTFNVTTGQGVYFRKGDVIQDVNTGENMYVQVVTGDQLQVARAIGSVTATAMGSGDIILIIGNANQEGATGRVIKSTTKTPLFNWTQIFRWPFGLTRTLNQSELYGGSDLAFQTRKAGIEHRINMERAFLFGQKKDDTSGTPIGDGTTALRFCDGLKSRITSNVTTASSVSAVTVETFLQTGMRYGPARKLLFASRAFMSYLNTIATNKIVTVPTTSSFPLALTEYVSPHGKIYLITHNLLTGVVGTTQNYGGWAFLLDLDSIFYRYLQGSDTMLKTNIQANDEDARKDEYITEACPMIIQEKNHAVWNSVTAGG